MQIMLNSKEFKKGLECAYGIVGDKNILQQMKYFYFKTGPKFLYIIGTDANLTFMSKVNAVYDEFKERNFSIKADILYTIIKASELETTLKIDRDKCDVSTENGRSKLLLGTEDLNIDTKEFDFDIANADDCFDSDMLLYIMKSLTPILSKNSGNPQNHIIYVDGERIYASNESVMAYINHKSNRKYILKDKDANCLIDILSDFPGKVYFKYINNDTVVIVKTGDYTFTFRSYEDDEMPDISVYTALTGTLAVAVDKQEFIKKISLSNQLSEDNSVEFVIDENSFVVRCNNNFGEESYYPIKIKKASINDSYTIKVPSSSIVSLAKIVRENILVLNFNVDYGIIKLSDIQKKSISVISGL